MAKDKKTKQEGIDEQRTYDEERQAFNSFCDAVHQSGAAQPLGVGPEELNEDGTLANSGEEEE